MITSMVIRGKGHIGGVYQYGSISVSILESIYGGGFRGFPPQNHDSTKKKKRTWGGIFSKAFGCGSFGERFISLGGGRQTSILGNKIISRNNIYLSTGNSRSSAFVNFPKFVRSKKKWKYYKK
jgi:hypothetical protein